MGWKGIVARNKGVEKKGRMEFVIGVLIVRVRKGLNMLRNFYLMRISILFASGA